jgi:AhpC/TSA antioxidant enzyme
VHCRDHAVQLHRARDRFEAEGVDLVLIGQATPRQAKAFGRKLGLDEQRILADEDRATYKLAGFRRANLTQLLGPQSVLSGIRHGARSGVVQGRVIGDAAQLGGAMLVRPGGEVTLHRGSEHAGDTIEPDDLLAAATAA